MSASMNSGLKINKTTDDKHNKTKSQPWSNDECKRMRWSDLKSKHSLEKIFSK